VALLRQGSKLEKAIQDACETLEDIFNAEHGDNQVKKKLCHAWNNVHDAISQAGDSNLKKRLRNILLVQLQIEDG
jgi:hypothetical protein